MGRKREFSFIALSDNEKAFLYSVKRWDVWEHVLRQARQLGKTDSELQSFSEELIARWIRGKEERENAVSARKRAEYLKQLDPEMFDAAFIPFGDDP